MDTVLERVYYTPVQTQVRDEPMQVLALGIQRSGTESLARALDILGYKTYHGWNVFLRPNDAMLWHFLGQLKYGPPSKPTPIPQLSSNNLDTTSFDLILSLYTAATDFPACAFAPELYRAYPSAKIILNTRPVEAWHASWLKTIYQIRIQNSRFGAQVLARFGRRKFWQMQVGKLNEAFWRRCSLAELKHTSKWQYEEHSAMIRGMVATMSELERKERFLEWAIGDAWEPLCRFLGKEVPKEEFPSGNATKEAMERLMPIVKAAEMEALRNLRAVIVGFLAVVGAVVWLVFMSR